MAQDPALEVYPSLSHRLLIREHRNPRRRTFFTEAKLSDGFVYITSPLDLAEAVGLTPTGQEVAEEVLAVARGLDSIVLLNQRLRVQLTPPYTWDDCDPTDRLTRFKLEERIISLLHGPLLTATFTISRERKQRDDHGAETWVRCD